MSKQFADDDIPQVMRETKKIASALLRGEGRAQSLQTTDLYDEMVVRVLGMEAPRVWENSSHFIATARRMMRRILIDRARYRTAQVRDVRRNIQAEDIDLFNLATVVEKQPAIMLALDDALKELKQQDEEAFNIVEKRYFVGLTLEELAKELGTSLSTVQRRFQVTHARLGERIEQLCKGKD